MKRSDWLETILEIPLFDTHTHINNPGVPVPAQNFWDVAHYFWFFQELQSVGYPKEIHLVPEKERIGLFLKAYGAARNTLWARGVGDFFRDVHGIRLDDESSVRRADEAVRETAGKPDWPGKLLKGLGIRHITVNREERCDLPGLDGVGVAVPLWNEYDTWVSRIEQSPDPGETLDRAERAADEFLRGIVRRGRRGIRMSSLPFEGEALLMSPEDLPAGRTVSPEEAHGLLAHRLLRAAGDHDLFVQLFLGIDGRVTGGLPMAVNDPRRIARLYPLFERYSCDFELVAGAEGDNMDIVQAARIFPNVYAGALWWYNFRSSTYRRAMGMRLEAVPAPKCCLLASDARCVEWCHIKTKLVKRLLAEFLQEQVEKGWIGRSDALWAAREWLYEAPARRYLSADTASPAIGPG